MDLRFSGLFVKSVVTVQHSASALYWMVFVWSVFLLNELQCLCIVVQTGLIQTWNLAVVYYFHLFDSSLIVILIANEIDTV